MKKDDNILINSQSTKLWDCVAETYSEAANTAEIKLGQEIEQLFLGLGIEPGASLLEVGCGSGHLSGYLASKGFNTSLMDFSKNSLEKAQSYYNKYGLKGNFILEDMLKFSGINGEKYDIVWNSGVFEHYDPWEVVESLKRMANVSKKYVVILVPNAKSIPYLLFRRRAMENNEWIWGRELLRDSMKHLAGAAGLEIVDEIYLGEKISQEQIDYAGFDEEYKDVLKKSLAFADQRYLIATITRVKTENISRDLEVYEQILRDEGKVNQKTYFFDLFSASNGIQKLQNNFFSIKDDLDKKNSEINKLLNNISELEIKSTSKISELESRLVDKNDEINNLNDHIKTHENYTHSLKVEIERMHSLRSWKIITLIGNKYAKIKSVSENLQKLLISFFGKILPQTLKRKITRVIERNNSIESIVVNQKNFDSKNNAFTPLPIKIGTVNILTPTFFNYSGNDMYYGGAERYLIELVRLIRKKGYKVNVYQNGTSDWIRFYNDIKVIGLNSGGNSQILNNKFHTEIPPGELTIYLAFYLAYPYCHKNSIGISHGVYWDNESMQRNAIINKNDNDINTALRAIRNCNKIVSVDTNTINWIRAIDYGESEKFTYIPNFVDLSQFYPNNSSGNRDKIVILYPRRLCVVRGFWLVEKIVPDILKRYPHTEFYFVGKGDKEEIQRVSELVKKYPDRVKWFNLQPEEMQDAYQCADITLIPTINSEGTSLSCLEAMACGNAVIATNVGGLPNLILDGYNGYLIEPNVNDLKEKIELLIKDNNLRDYIQKNATEIVKKFGKEKWTFKWNKVLSENLSSKNQEIVTENEKDLTIVHVSTSFIKWSFMQQRPHQLCKEFVNKKIYTFFVVQDDDYEKKYSSNYLQVLTKKDDLYLEKPILYIYYPHNYEQIKNFKNHFVIYDILDDISIHKQSDLVNKLPENKTAIYYHEKLLSEADLVITTATNLYEKYKNVRNDIILVPNGVNYNDFSKDEYHLPSDFPSQNKKVIGYYGAIANWVDYNLIEYAAKSRPDYYFVYIGPVSDKRWNDVSKHKNIIYLGTKKYEELADYLHYFDVAIVPFEINEITKATSPVKIFEYMAGKKPIVATDLPECRKYESILVSKSHEEFVKNLDLALKLKDDKHYLALLEKEAKENTWDKRADIIINAIKERV